MKDDTYYGPCACLGPGFNEPYCPCVMRQKGLPRSDAWIEYHSPENTKIREEKMRKAFAGFCNKGEKK